MSEKALSTWMNPTQAVKALRVVLKAGTLFVEVKSINSKEVCT